MRHHDNHIQLTGRAGRTPELHTLTDGTPVARLRLYLNVPESDGSGGRESQAFALVAWAGVARRLCEVVRRGSRITVHGHLRNRTFQHEGQTHVRSEIHLEHFQCLARGQPSPMPPDPSFRSTHPIV